jgi:hypothetical protein
VKSAAGRVLAAAVWGLDHAIALPRESRDLMRELRGSARRRVTGASTPIRWVVTALLAAGVLLAVLERDVGPWLVAMAGALATFVALAGLVVSRAAEKGDRSVAQHVQDGRAALQSELARSRRHDRQFAIVGIPDDLWWLPAVASEDKAQLGVGVAESVQALVRRPDRAWVDGPMLHVLLTDCDRRRGLAFLERAGLAMPQLFMDDRVNLVVFPDDGITMGALVARLNGGPAGPLRKAVGE